MLKAKYDDEDLFGLYVSQWISSFFFYQSLWNWKHASRYNWKTHWACDWYQRQRNTNSSGKSYVIHMLYTFMENIIIEPKFFEACLRSSPTTLSSSSHWDSVFPTHNNLLQLTLSNYRTENCVDSRLFKNGYFSPLVSGDWKMAKVGNTVKILPSNLKTLNGRRWRNGSIVWAFVLFKFGKASKVVEAFFEEWVVAFFWSSGSLYLQACGIFRRHSTVAFYNWNPFPWNLKLCLNEDKKVQGSSTITISHVRETYSRHLSSVSKDWNLAFTIYV